jgi:alkanesulfonate monooxygenase SsuD/methylene tetrahydromethanopterin reductase-like flavin-dependent oxidoreductase (luciferase family)
VVIFVIPGTLSFIEHRINRIGIGFNTDLSLQQMIKHAGVAENFGLDSVWFHEHSFGRDAISYLIGCLLKTTQTKFGVACLTPYTRHPLVLAMSMLTLQEVSGGRIILGLGTGFPMRLDALGISHDKPIRVLRETIEICKRVWSGESVTYDGKSFSLKNVRSIAGKARSKIPIFIAGWRKQMLALTGAIADGYVAKGGESPQSLSRIVSEIKASAEKHQRNIEDLEICGYLLTYVGQSERKAFDVARKDPFVNYMLSVQDEYLYEESGINPELKKPIAENYFKGHLEESCKHITDEMLEAFTLCGKVDEVGERINHYKKSGLNLPILQPISMKEEDVKSVLETARAFSYPEEVRESANL